MLDFASTRCPLKAGQHRLKQQSYRQKGAMDSFLFLISSDGLQPTCDDLVASS